MAWFLALLLLAGPQKWPIDSLSVEGLQNYTQQQTLDAAGLKAGQTASKEDFDAARDRLLKAGVFETVGYRFAPAPGSKGYAATFQVVEVEPVYNVRFEGLKQPDAAVLAWLHMKDPFASTKMPATDTLLHARAAAIQQYLESKGQAEKIEGKVIADSPITLPSCSGRKAALRKVAEVRFVGNTVIPSDTLLNNFAGIAYGTVYSEQAFRQLLDASIRPLYDARGRVRVAFPKIVTEKAKTVEGLVVTATVDEGESYDLGEVKLAGRWPAPAKDMLKVGGFKTGDLANFDDVNAGLERMKKRLHREGYTRASLTAERHVNDEKKTVDLLIQPDFGRKFLFGALTIEGLDLNGEPAIRKMWALKPGQPFDVDYPDYFLDQIREQGLFDGLGKTKSDKKVDEQTGVVDVTLTFGASTESGAGSRATSRRRGN